MFEFPALVDGQREMMVHIFKRLITNRFFFDFLLYIIEELQLVHHVKQRILVNIFQIELVRVQVVDNFGVYFWLIEVGQHFLSYAHFKL